MSNNNNNNNLVPGGSSDFSNQIYGSSSKMPPAPVNRLGIPKIENQPGIPSQPLDLTGGLTMEDHDGPAVNALELVAAVPQNLVQPAEASTTTPTVNKPRERNDGLGVPGINQPDVTTGNLSHSNEASTTTPIIDRITDVNQTPYYVDKSDDETIGFLLDCATRGKNRGNQSPSIRKVSRILRDLSVRSFIPQLVSIGPIHRENKKLKEFEWLKGCYLDDLLNRCGPMPKKTLEAFLQKVNELMPQIKESYAGVKKSYSDVELARMMVMDGCFILEFCFKHEDANFPNKMQNLRIAMDLMLLENQVPFFVLQALFDCSMVKVSITLSRVLDNYLAPYIELFCLLPEKKSILSNIHDKYLAPYIKLFRSLLPNSGGFGFCRCCSLLPEKISTTDVGHSDSSPAHVLGYLHKRYQLVPSKSSNLIQNAAFHSIVELDRSGMNFKPHQENEWSMTIKFQSSLFACLPWFRSKPTLLMPTLIIDDTTELILRNFIAYEQSFLQDHYYFTSYAHAMSMLIDSKEDIAKLVESKVLVNNLGSNQEAADMIHKICKNMFVPDFYYTREFKQMDKYYNSFWPMIKRTYFSNPWNAINLLFGIIAFLATVVAAIFAILEYFR